MIGGGPIPVDVVREQIDDAFLKVVSHNGVDIQTIAHHGRRLVASPLHTVLELGPAPDFDGVMCAESGCHRTYGLQWDHVDPCANGGLTSFANLRPLCTTTSKRRSGIEKPGCSEGGAGTVNAGDSTPPSISKILPVTQLKRPTRGNSTAAAMSSGWPTRCIGVFASSCSRTGGR